MRKTNFKTMFLWSLAASSFFACGGDEAETTPMEMKVTAAADNEAKGGLEKFIRLAPSDYTLKKDTTDSVSQVQMEIELEASKTALLEIDSLIVTINDANNTPVNVKADFKIDTINGKVNIEKLETIASKAEKTTLLLTSVEKLTFEEWKELLEKGNNLTISTSGAREIIYLDGEIGGHHVVLTLSKEGEKVKGQYWYGRHRGGVPLLLSGSWNANGEFDINEVNVDGMPTGHFVGTVNKKRNIEGTFTNYRNETYDFILEEEPLE